MLSRVLFLILLCMPFAVQADEPLFLSHAKKHEEGLVVKVVRADVCVLENGQRIKLIGIESVGEPERKFVERDERGNVIEDKEITFSIEEQALTFAQELMENKKIRLEYDTEQRSPEGYKYAYVFLPDQKMANIELLRMGFVHLSIALPNIKYADQLRAAYHEARQEKRGILGE